MKSMGCKMRRSGTRAAMVAVAAAAAVLLAVPATAAAEDLALATDPMTVRVGEELRITLFNPQNEPVTLKVFAYNAAENNYDEGPPIVLAPGRMRFFDFRLTKEFVGFTGILEAVPDAMNGVAASSSSSSSSSASSSSSSSFSASGPSSASAQKGEAKPSVMLTDILVSSVKSRAAVQHRGTTGQSQTLGFSWGALSQGGVGIRTVIPASAVKVTRSAWIASPATE